MTRSKFNSLKKILLWLVAGSTFLLASLVSLLYFLQRDSRSKLRKDNSNPARMVGQDDVENKTFQVSRIKPETPKKDSILNTSVENIKLPDQKGNATRKRFEALNIWPLLDLTKGKVKKVAWPLIAILFAYFAQGVFDSTKGEGIMSNSTWLAALTEASRLWLGAGIYMACMLVWAFTAPAFRSNVTKINPLESSGLQKSRYHPLRFFLLITGIGSYSVSVLLFVASGENGFIRGLWAVGLVIFIISQVPWLGIRTVLPHPEAEESPRFRWQNWLVLVLILIMAFWLRFYKLASIPDDLHGDMAIYGLTARDFLLGVEKNIFGDSGFYGIPLMAYLPAAFSMSVFGNNLFGLQISSVIEGVFSLLAVYLLVWRIFDNHRIAVLATVLTSINIAYIHFSRIAAYMDPWFFGFFALYFCVDGLKGRRAASFGFAGVFLGFCLQMYFSGRVVPFIIVFFLLYTFIFRRSWIIQNKYKLVLIVIGVFVAMGPALIFHITHFDDFVARSRGVFIFTSDSLQHLFYGYKTDSPFIVFLIQTYRSLLMFNLVSDTSGQFGFPHSMFNSLISPLIVLGLGYALRYWKSAGMFFALTWIGLMAVLGSILTIDAPFWPRLVGIVPVAALLIALVLEQFFEIGQMILGQYSSLLTGILVFILLAIVGYINWNQYYQFAKDNGSPPTMTGQYVSRLPSSVTVCGIFTDFRLDADGTTRFLAWPRKLVDVMPDALDSELNRCVGQSLVWVLSPENLSRLDAIRTLWPNGIVQVTTKHDYTLTFYLVGVNPPDH